MERQEGNQVGREAKRQNPKGKGMLYWIVRFVEQSPCLLTILFLGGIILGPLSAVLREYSGWFIVQGSLSNLYPQNFVHVLEPEEKSSSVVDIHTTLW